MFMHRKKKIFFISLFALMLSNTTTLASLASSAIDETQTTDAAASTSPVRPFLSKNMLLSLLPDDERDLFIPDTHELPVMYDEMSPLFTAYQSPGGIASYIRQYLATPETDLTVDNSSDIRPKTRFQSELDELKQCEAPFRTANVKLMMYLLYQYETRQSVTLKKATYLRTLDLLLSDSRATKLRKLPINLTKKDGACFNYQHLRFAKHVHMPGGHVSSQYLKHLKSLDYLDISYSQIRHDKGVGNFDDLREVKHLNLAHCPLTEDSDLDGLGGQKYVDLTANPKITDRVAEIFSAAEVLILAKCPRITNAALRHLSGKKYVSLSGNSNITPDGFADMVNVDSLDVSFCDHVDNDAMPQLARIPKLNLTCTAVTDNGLHHLKPYVKSLNLSGCQGITSAGIADLGDLEELFLNGCNFIDDTVFQHIGHSGAKTVEVSANDNITGATLHYLRQDLETVILHSCPNIHNDHLRHISHAKIVDLTNHGGITNEGVKHLKHVRVLHLANNPLITDEGVLALEGVEEINLYGCTGVSENAKEALRARGVKLLDDAYRN